MSCADKSLGMSLDCVQVDLSGMRGDKSGLAYSALSRARSLAGLYLTSAIKPSDVKVSAAVAKSL